MKAKLLCLLMHCDVEQDQITSTTDRSVEKGVGRERGSRGTSGEA